MKMAPSPAVQPQIASMRWLFVIAGILAGIAGIQLFVLSEQTDRYFAWTIVPPLMAAFLGAAFWTGALGVFLAARERTWAGARSIFLGAGVFTLLILITTLLHLDRFHLKAADGPAIGFALVWLAVYIGLPPVMVVLLLRQMRAPGTAPARGAPLAPWQRAALALVTLGIVAVSAGLFLAPQGVLSLWPWNLTPLTARVVASVLMTMATLIGVLAWENDRSRLKISLIGLVVGALLESIALARYLGEAHWERPAAWLYVLSLLALFVVGFAGLLGRR